MNKTYSLIMKVYLVILSAKAIAKFCNFYLPISKEFLYFKILSAFHPYFYLDYTANAVQVVLNMWQIVPVYYFIYGQRPQNIHLWRLLLIIKIIFDLIGNSYAGVMFRAAYYDGGWPLLVIYVALSVVIYIPATMIWFLIAFQDEYVYAFRRESSEKINN